MKSLNNLVLPGLILCAAVSVTGCATKGYVNNRIDELGLTQRMDALTRDQATLQNSTVEALARAESAAAMASEARDLALGKVGLQELASTTIYFGFNKDEISDESRQALEAFAGQIGEEPASIVDVYGFADPVGSDRYNLDLGQRRAGEVVRYLVEQSGSNLGRFAAVSYGERSFRGREVTGDDHAQYRRVVVSLLKRVPQSGTGEGKGGKPVANQLP